MQKHERAAAQLTNRIINLRPKEPSIRIVLYLKIKKRVCACECERTRKREKTRDRKEREIVG